MEGGRKRRRRRRIVDLFEETSILIPWSLFFFPSFCRLRGRITSSNSLSFSLSFYCAQRFALCAPRGKVGRRGLPWCGIDKIKGNDRLIRRSLLCHSDFSAAKIIPNFSIRAIDPIEIRALFLSAVSISKRKINSQKSWERFFRKTSFFVERVDKRVRETCDAEQNGKFIDTNRLGISFSLHFVHLTSCNYNQNTR